MISMARAWHVAIIKSKNEFCLNWKWLFRQTYWPNLCNRLLSGYECLIHLSDMSKPYLELLCHSWSVKPMPWIHMNEQYYSPFSENRLIHSVFSLLILLHNLSAKYICCCEAFTYIQLLLPCLNLNTSASWNMSNWLISQMKAFSLTKLLDPRSLHRCITRK